MALLKNACAHEAGEELALGVRGGARARAALLPCLLYTSALFALLVRKPISRDNT